MKRHNAIKKDNQKTLMFLKRQGYPLPLVRRALMLLNEIQDSDIARPLGVTRMSIALHILGLRRNPETQKTIAAYLRVDRSDLFTEDR
jgi:hypothetical protein